MSRPIRVAWIAGEPTPYRVPQLRLLAERPEIDLSVVYATRTFQNRSWTVEHDGATFLRGPSLPTQRILHHDYPVTPGIWRFLAHGGFDLVVAAGWSTFAAQAAILWCRTHGMPYVLVSENHMRERRPTWVKVVKRAVLRHVVPPAAGALVTGTLAREHIVHYGARADRVVVFPNTVDVDALAAQADELRLQREELRSRLGVGTDELVVLQVGRLIPVKGTDTLVRAVGRARRHTDATLRLVVAGDGPEREHLRDLAAAQGVRLTMTGHVEGDALASLYAAADIFALLSRRETWGVVVNEAMACGLPIVLSTSVGAGPDLLRPEGNGLLVPVDDPVSAAEAIARLAGDPAARAAFGRRSREIVAGWGYDGGISRFCTLVDTIVEERRASSDRDEVDG